MYKALFVCFYASVCTPLSVISDFFLFMFGFLIYAGPMFDNVFGLIQKCVCDCMYVFLVLCVCVGMYVFACM